MTDYLQNKIDYPPEHKPLVTALTQVMGILFGKEIQNRIELKTLGDAKKMMAEPLKWLAELEEAISDKEPNFKALLNPDIINRLILFVSALDADDKESIARNSFAQAAHNTIIKTANEQEHKIVLDILHPVESICRDAPTFLSLPAMAHLIQPDSKTIPFETFICTMEKVLLGLLENLYKPLFIIMAQITNCLEKKERSIPNELGMVLCQYRKIWEKAHPELLSFTDEKIAVVRNAIGHGGVDIDPIKETVQFRSINKKGVEKKAGPWTREEFAQFIKHLSELINGLWVAERRALIDLKREANAYKPDHDGISKLLEDQTKQNGEGL